MAGAPIGNQNARTGSLVRGAIRRVLAENEAKGRESLVEIARTLITNAEQGDLAAAKEVFDRLDGKAVATTEIAATLDATVRAGLAPIYGLQPPSET